VGAIGKGAHDACADENAQVELGLLRCRAPTRGNMACVLHSDLLILQFNRKTAPTGTFRVPPA